MSTGSLVVQDYAGITVASISNSAMLDGRSIDATGEALYRLTDELNKRKIIIDFSDVRFLSSQAIGVVISMHQKAKKIKGEVVLCGVRKEIMKIFKITALDKVLTFFPDEKTALKNFGVHVR